MNLIGATVVAAVTSRNVLRSVTTNYTEDMNTSDFKHFYLYSTFASIATLFGKVESCMVWYVRGYNCTSPSPYFGVDVGSAFVAVDVLTVVQVPCICCHAGERLSTEEVMCCP